jgi:Uncharacterized protein conserved in bacteria
VADHITEEEQIEALKTWWNDNWVSIVLPILIVIIGYAGWNLWGGYKESKAAEASKQFETLMNTYQDTSAPLTGEQKTELGVIANDVAAERSGTLYADMANLILARLSVEDNQLDAAESRLQSVVDGGSNLAMQELAKARLARVLSAKGEYDAALAAVANPTSDSYKSLYAEIRGDIYLAQSKMAEANTAYSMALDTLPPSEFNRRGLIQLKLDAVSLPQTVNAGGDA